MKKLIMILSVSTLIVSCGTSPNCQDETNGVVLTEQETALEKEGQEVLDLYTMQDSIGENLYKWGDKWVPESKLDSLIALETTEVLDSLHDEMDKSMED
jgi:hypothetical protein|tara:strand:+ start:1645 stop:1941 length:297 start_codon:yes stop_codon:yes gene_type:complete